MYLANSDLPVSLSEYELPVIGYPLEMNEKILPAEVRFSTQAYTSCHETIVTDTEPEKETIDKIQFVNGELLIAPHLLPATIEVYSLDGRLLEYSNTIVPSNALGPSNHKELRLIVVYGARLEVGM